MRRIGRRGPSPWWCPYAAGGPADIVGRIVVPRMTEALGQQVVVENVGGAGGITGAARVARASPDGYQFMMGPAGLMAQNESLYKHLPYNLGEGFHRHRHDRDGATDPDRAQGSARQEPARSSSPTRKRMPPP